MRVLVTGATGQVGSAVAGALTAAGHAVVGLARSDAAAVTLTAAGLDVRRGDLLQPESLRAAAAAADGVVHCAYVRDPDAEAAGAIDLRAVEALAAALAGTGRPLVVTSVTTVLASDRFGAEAQAASPHCLTPARVASEAAALAAADHGVRAVVLRLPPTVLGDHHARGLLARLIGLARETGIAAVVGDGEARTASVHREDAAALYRLALEHAVPGTRLHAVADEDATQLGIAERIAAHLRLPVVRVPEASAELHFHSLTPFVATDQPVSGATTRSLLGWAPARPGVLEWLASGAGYD